MNRYESQYLIVYIHVSTNLIVYIFILILSALKMVIILHLAIFVYIYIYYEGYLLILSQYQYLDIQRYHIIPYIIATATRLISHH